MKEIISDITQFMRDHTGREVSVEELASDFGYSKFHFSREFKKIIGVSPNEYWAALKMEQSLYELERASLLRAHLNTGYQSTGTFVTSFKKNTGLTPGEYQDEIQKLSMYTEAKNFEKHGNRILTHYSFDKNNLETVQNKALHITCNLPYNFKGLVFVGIFKKPMPTGAPIVGKAMVKTNQCVIDHIPNGEYYALACAINSDENPLIYFQPKKWLRDIHREAYHFPLKSDTHIEFTLRESDLTDPAIPVNLLKLLTGALHKKD